MNEDDLFTVLTGLKKSEEDNKKYNKNQQVNNSGDIKVNDLATPLYN
jgi:hypothetical protein